MNHGGAAEVARSNIEAIREIEMRAVSKRSRAERFADWIALQAGQVRFVLLHLLWFSLWVVWNASASPLFPKFDPYPFIGLTTAVSLESIILTAFILATQNRATRRADERAHLDLQINLLAEREATKMLQMLQSICRKLNLPEATDGELTELIKRTRPEELADQLAESLVDPSAPQVVSPNGSGATHPCP